MISKNLVLILATISAVSAAPSKRQDPCQDAYKKCIANGTPQVACSCTLASCTGEDNARNREYCDSATASLNLPKSTEIPGGCNPAHPGSCPTSTFTTITTKVTPTFTPCSSYFTHPVASSTKAQPKPTEKTEAPKPRPETPGSTGYTDPKPVAGKTWKINDLNRYCGEDNSGCDYNFVIEADGKTEQCTVIRKPGSNAATESWSNEPCTSGSNFKVSWGYVTEPAPAYAVITVVDDKEVAWFGVSNVNGQKVTTTPSNPFGSGQFGDLPASQVYTY